MDDGVSVGSYSSFPSLHRYRRICPHRFRLSHPSARLSPRGNSHVSSCGSAPIFVHYMG
ncbi:hypothetical protein PISMIDRAFT_676385 [Pisolithus microcarpus 441]|uniref:Uncharacterized protein n=1 Tax=Pisolithus microcarpus 441 TaxID=765257 RepID=A0A0C9ZAC6_9AGAM|nr:hypothetical protein PISMIDRAFT_676385 [Pisolithus microcarpus 441]